MRNSVVIKSSFSLPPEEVSLVMRLKKKLNLKSNTEVVRQALYDLEAKLSRNELRNQFLEASSLVQKHNDQERRDLDSLSDEGLGGY